MATGDGGGFEIFEFINPRIKAAKMFEAEYERAGFFHICVTDADPGGSAKRFEAREVNGLAKR